MWLQVSAKQEESDRQAAEVARLHTTTPDQLYYADLDAFEAALDERDEEDAREAELLVTQRGRAGRAGGGKVQDPRLQCDSPACLLQELSQHQLAP